MTRPVRVATESDAGASAEECPFAVLTGRPPLVSLLARAQHRYVAEMDARLRRSPHRGLSLAHSTNVMRFLGAGPRRASQFASECGVTKQALSQQIAQLEALGYVHVAPDPADHRARLVSLTDRGVAAQAYIDTCFTELENEWADELADAGLSRLRDTLQRVLRIEQPASEP